MAFRFRPVFLSGFWTPLLKFNNTIFCQIGRAALWLSQTVLFSKLAHNVLQLGEVAEIEAQMFKFAQSSIECQLNLALNPPFCQLKNRLLWAGFIVNSYFLKVINAVGIHHIFSPKATVTTS